MKNVVSQNDQPATLPDTTDDTQPVWHCAWCEPYPIFAPNGATSGICSDCAAELEAQTEARRAKQSAS